MCDCISVNEIRNIVIETECIDFFDFLVYFLNNNIYKKSIKEFSFCQRQTTEFSSVKETQPDFFLPKKDN